MTKMYGSYSDEDLNDWERLPQNAEVLTTSGFGAWLMRRDERRKKQEPRWIPVSERLPERDVNVLAYVIGVGIEYQRVMWIDDCTGEWVGFVGSGYMDRVIAWMPLPKPFEPQETETWNGIHTQTTAPKGTFEKIWNEAKESEE